jgi:hypothetical protein
MKHTITNLVLAATLIADAVFGAAPEPPRDNADGEPFRKDRPGVVICNTAEGELMRMGVLLFRDRQYRLAELPTELERSAFLQTPMEGQKKLRCVRPGTVHILTPLPDRNPSGSQRKILEEQGFAKVALRELRLFKHKSNGTLCSLYQKDCEPGETIRFGKWAVPIVFPEARATPNDARPAPGETTVTVAGREHPVPKVHFDPGPEYADANRRFGIASSITRTPGGRLWCGFSSGGERESQDNFGVVVISDDDGLTWSKPYLVLDQDGPGGIRSDHVTVWSDPRGKLWVMWSESPLGLVQPHSSQWAVTCDNPDAARPVWSEPRKLVDEQNLLTTPTVMTNGTWIFPSGNWERQRNKPRPLISNDQGETFFLGGELTVDEKPDFDEYMVVERSDGSLVIFNRHAGSFLQCESSDGGQTWSAQRPNGLPHDNARFVFMKLRSGNWLLVKHGPIDRRVGRRQLMAHLSRNEGKTWEGGLMLEDRTCSYPFGFQSDDGTIYVSYERERWLQPEILLARFTEEDVLAGKPVSDRAALKRLVNKAGGISGESYRRIQPKTRPEKKTVTPTP